MEHDRMTLVLSAAFTGSDKHAVNNKLLRPSLLLPFFCFLYAFFASHSVDNDDKSEIKKFEMSYFRCFL